MCTLVEPRRVPAPPECRAHRPLPRTCPLAGSRTPPRGGNRSPPRYRSPPRGGGGGGGRPRNNSERISLLVRNLGERTDLRDIRYACMRAAALHCRCLNGERSARCFNIALHSASLASGEHREAFERYGGVKDVYQPTDFYTRYGRVTITLIGPERNKCKVQEYAPSPQETRRKMCELACLLASKHNSSK